VLYIEIKQVKCFGEVLLWILLTSTEEILEDVAISNGECDFELRE
jgi:hypothetical protein